MSKRNNSKLEQYNEYCSELKGRYYRYHTLFHRGCNDPNWCDGVNLNLVRNHIIHYKKCLEDILGDRYWLYPDEYFYPEPIELPDTLMVQSRISRVVGYMQKSVDCPSYKEVLFYDEVG